MAFMFLIKYYSMIREKDLSTEYTLLYGIAKKSCFEMNAAEWEKAAATAYERAKEVAFTRGLPIIYGENGYVIAEYSDGRRFVREEGKDIKPYYGR
jgi:hypothetical protein